MMPTQMPPQMPPGAGASAVQPIVQGMDKLVLGEGRPTVLPAPNFNAEADAQALRKAMKGFFVEDHVLTEILGKRTAKQRLAIALQYKTMYGRDLIQDIKHDTGGHYERLLIGLLQDRPHYDAMCLREAMKGLGTNDTELIEVLCCRNNQELREIKAAYKELYITRDLEKDVVSETGGRLKHLLVACLQANREETTTMDMEKAHREAEELYKAGEKTWFYADDSKFNQILATRSIPQLRATFAEYRKVSSYDIVRSIEHEFSGELQKAFKAVVQCMKDPADYFADVLYHTMKGIGTADRHLIRLVITRSEIDMVEVKEAFFNKFNKSLAKMIKDDTSGNYCKLLVALVGEG